MSTSTENQYQSRIAELIKTQKNVERYRAILSAMVSEAWNGVTKEELARAVEQHKGIDDILAELDRASTS